MASPIIALPWQYRVNRKILGSPVAGSFPPQYLIATLAQNTYWDIKESLKGSGAWTDITGAAVTPSGNWSCSFSCDGSGGAGSFGAPGDGVDRWVAPANLVSAAGANPRSWIVLKQPGIAPNFELCIELNSANPYLATFVISPNSRFGIGGGGVGAANARPTALDEIVVINTNDLGCSITAENSNRVHVMKAANGQATRVIICRDGFAAALWCLEQPGKPLTTWENPSIALVTAANTARMSFPQPNLTTLNNATIANGRSRNYPNGVPFASLLSMSSGGASFGLDPSVMPGPNDMDGATPFYGIDLFNKATFGARGRAGVMQDAWYVPANYTDSLTVPDDDTRQFVMVGILAMPWNRSIASWH